MRPPRALGLLSLVLVITWSSASPARAWTQTVVHSARATIEVEPDSTLSILLRVDVEVHAGWLHELELVDLGPNVELDRYRPPYVRSEEGELFRPEAELHEDGRIRLWFNRRDAPRHGEYRVFLRYRTSADVRIAELKGEPRARIVWSVPTWETGLHDVSVEVRAPKGASVPDDANESSPGIDFEISEGANRTIVRWRRIHLPRMTPWPLTIDAPPGSLAVPDPEEAAPAPDGFRALKRRREHPFAWALLALAILTLLKRRHIERKLGRASLWVRLSWPWTLVGTALIVGFAQWLAPAELAWGLPLLGLILHRRPAEPSVDVSREWLPASLAELDDLDVPDPLDATTWLGAILFGLSTACLYALGQPAGALLLLPVFLGCTRLHRAPTKAEAFHMLRELARDLALPADAPPMSFSWERAGDGFPRLRIHLSSGRAGLRAVSLSAISSSLGFVRSRGVMLLVETRAQSDADDLMRRRMPENDQWRKSDGTIVRLVPWDAEAIDLLRVLACKAPKPVKASRGTWLLREISENGRQAA